MAGCGLPRCPYVKKGNSSTRAERRRMNWQPIIFRYSTRIAGNPQDAEDLAQEAWLKLGQALSKQPDRPITKAFLYRIVRNTWIDSRRKRRIRTVPLVPDEEAGGCLPVRQGAAGAAGRAIAAQTGRYFAAYGRFRFYGQGNGGPYRNERRSGSSRSRTRSPEAEEHGSRRIFRPTRSRSLPCRSHSVRCVGRCFSQPRSREDDPGLPRFVQSRNTALPIGAHRRKAAFYVHGPGRQSVPGYAKINFKLLFDFFRFARLLEREGNSNEKG